MIIQGLPMLKFSANLKDVIDVLNASAQQIVLVVDELEILKGVISDGDLRRAMLEGKNLASFVEEIINPDPVTVSAGTLRSQVIDLMLNLKIHQIPCVDEFHKVIGLYTLDNLLEPQKYENTVVLMAGGKGSRLGELTASIPKPMLPVNGRPILERLVQGIRSEGFRNICISVNYLSKQITDHFGDGEKFNVKIDYIHETKPLGTAGSLYKIKNRFDKPVVVMNGDLITHVPLRSLIEFHIEGQAEITVCVREHLIEIPYGVIETSDSRVTGIVEKPIEKWYVSAGIYVLSERVTQYLINDTAIDMPDLIRSAMEDGLRVIPYPMHEDWIDVGRPNDYERAQETLDV